MQVSLKLISTYNTVTCKWIRESNNLSNKINSIYKIFISKIFLFRIENFHKLDFTNYINSENLKAEI